jgi:hypothetical protein
MSSTLQPFLHLLQRSSFWGVLGGMLMAAAVAPVAAQQFEFTLSRCPPGGIPSLPCPC